MKPLRLSIQAFGPFAEEQTLDFGDLAGQDFFLIHGPTGAGKTSILDAISFALYGETSGGLREPRDMRSHFADPTCPTRIVFEFQLSGKTYRVERSPEQQVPRQKGGGSKKQVGSANLWELRDGVAVPLATEKASAVDAKVVELMGFKAGQFRQVVILPQGQFQEFLLASSVERQSILQVLFQTGRYARITEALGNQAQALKDEIRTLLAESKQLLEQGGVQDRPALQARIAELDDALASLRGKRKAADEARSSADAALQEARRIEVLVKERDESLAELERLRGRDAEMEARREGLEKARRADRVEPAARNLRESEEFLARLKEDETTQARDLQVREEALEQARTTLDQAERLESQRENLRRTIARLKELEPQLKLLEKHRDEMRSAARERIGLEAELQRQQKRREAFVTAVEEGQLRRQMLLVESTRADAMEFQLQQDRKFRKSREDADRIQTELRLAEDESYAAEASRKARETEFLQARQRLDLLRNQWNAGQAAVLAEGLKHGSPCPVCGSRIHPQLATATAGTLPSETELGVAQERFTEAESLLNRATGTATQRATDATRLKSKLETFLETMGDRVNETAEQLAALEAEHRQGLENARRAAEELGLLSTKLRAKEEEKALCEASILDFQARIVKAQEREASARGALEVLEHGILADLRVPGALSAQLGQVTENLKVLEQQLVEARNAHESAAAGALQARTRLETHRTRVAEQVARSDRHRIEFESALSDLGFRDSAEFLAARRDPEAQERLTHEIRLHNEAVASAEDRHQRARAQAGDQTRPDVDSLEAALETAQRTLGDLDEELGRTTADRGHLDRIATVLQTKGQETAEKERRFGILGHLSRVARGEEGAKVSFERFVQGAILDEVLASASQRLMRMSRNRYTLRRSSGPGDLRRASGLDLEVPDAHTGRARAASTLSGGEGFQASLALALGLSDVVQRHTGGVRLDTVFVDEGFGSLDPEALDLALRTLSELKQGGRLVGIISHLEELKQRIPARLEVLPAPRGSRAVFRFG